MTVLLLVNRGQNLYLLVSYSSVRLLKWVSVHLETGMLINPKNTILVCSFVYYLLTLSVVSIYMEAFVTCVIESVLTLTILSSKKVCAG